MVGDIGDNEKGDLRSAGCSKNDEDDNLSNHVWSHRPVSQLRRELKTQLQLDTARVVPVLAPVAGCYSWSNL